MKSRRGIMPMGLAIILFSISMSSVFASEIQLGGIRLGRSAITILQKYGNPTKINVGQSVQVETNTNITSPVTPAAPGAMTPPAGTPMVPGITPGMGVGLPGMTSGALPGMTGISPSPMGMQPQMPSQVVQSSTVKSAPEVTWIYKFSENRSLEFLISPDGRIVQIAAFGIQWSGISTARGIHLGDTYKEILAKYGYPETHEQPSEGQTVLVYRNTRVIFSLLGNDLVGITIALMD